MLLLFTLCMCLATMVYAKYAEYRPPITTYRTIAPNTAYQCSVSRYTIVSFYGQIACTSTLAGGQTGSISLQISPTSGGTYTTIATVQNSNSVSLSVAITVNQSNGATLCGVVPQGYYYKIVETSTTGTPTFTLSSTAQENQY